MQPGSGSLNNEISFDEYVADALKRTLNISGCNEVLRFCQVLLAAFQRFNCEFFTNEEFIRSQYDWYSLVCISFAIAWSAHPADSDACSISDILHEMCHDLRDHWLPRGDLFEIGRPDSVITERFKTYVQKSRVPSRKSMTTDFSVPTSGNSHGKHSISTPPSTRPT